MEYPFLNSHTSALDDRVLLGTKWHLIKSSSHLIQIIRFLTLKRALFF